MSDFTDLIRACDERVRLGPGEYPASDYPWGIKKVSCVDELIEAFRHGNWSVRTGFVLDDLAFVEQISGGDEWLALKLDGGKWKTFESVSFGHILERRGEEHVREYIGRLLETTWYELKYPREQAENSAPVQNGRFADAGNEDFEQVELFGKPALFTYSRINRETAPKDLYCYELRGSDVDPDMPTTVESKVGVNFVGTVIATAPVDFGGKDYRLLRGGLNFLGGNEVSLTAFLTELEQVETHQIGGITL